MANELRNTSQQELLPTLTDEQIVTERKSSRRSFLTSTGAALLASGAAVALTAGCGNDPDKTKSQAQNPDKTKSQAAQTPDKSNTGQDPDKAKSQSDPDSKKK